MDILSWPATVLRRRGLAISTISDCVVDSRKKELCKRSGRKDLCVLIELGICLASAGHSRLVKNLQNRLAIRLGSEISRLLTVNVEGNFLEP